MTVTMQYQEVERDLFGYHGKLYPQDMKIEVRPAGVPEIREWANIDENDVRSQSQHIIDIITKCTRVTSTTGNHNYSVKDIYEHDKMVLLLVIHDITFADKKDNALFVKGECENGACGKVFDKLRVTPLNLKYKVPDEKYDKYIDAELGMFRIQTKSYGVIEYRPSTIGLGQAMLNWLGSFKPAFIQANQQMFRIVQSYVTDWRSANDKALRKIQVEQYNQLNGEALAFRMNLLDEISIELLDELEYECPNCGATFRCQLALQSGYRQIFLPVQSLADELV